MKRLLLGTALLLVIFTTTATPDRGVWMAGGKNLTEGDTTYLSPKLGVASEHDVAEEVFRFTFGGSIRFSKVLVRMEDWEGARIPPGAKNAVTSVTIRPPRQNEKGLGKNDYVVDARVRTDRDQVRFNVSFIDADGFVRLDELASEGRVVVARPVPEGAEGLLLPVKNTWDEKLSFFRGDLLGPLPHIKSVEVTDTADSFHVEVTPDRRSFVLRGGELEAGKSMDVRIRFAAPGTERGALIFGSAYN